MPKKTNPYKNKSKMELFSRKSMEMAEKIKKGHLMRKDKHASMVDKKTHHLIAEMNAYGFLTIDSQSGDDETERAYVTGIMPYDKAQSFTRALNLNTNYISILKHPVSKNVPWESIDVTREKDDGTWIFYTQIPLYEDKESYDQEIERALGVEEIPKIPRHERLVIVECIDPKWGRKASSLYKTGLFHGVLKTLKTYQ